MHTRRAKERIDASCDLFKLLRNPLLKGCSLHRRLQIYNAVRKSECSHGRIRQVSLHLLHGAVKVESQILFYEVNERPDFLWLKRLRVNAPEHVQDVFGSQKREMMPAFEPYINPAWNGQNLVQRTQLRSRLQGWRHEMPDNLRLEGLAR